MKEKKNIYEICKLIDHIIEGSDNKIDYKYMALHLNNALVQKISYGDIDLLCETVIKIAKTKNRRIRRLERDFWGFINKVPAQNLLIQNIDIEENEELLSNADYDEMGKKIASRLLGLTLEILEIKDDNSNGSDCRRSGALRFIGELINYYHIPNAKELFINSINSKNDEEQYTALEGLAIYFSVLDDDIGDDLIQSLEQIKDETDDMTVVSTCLEIQINAGLIDEMTAICEMDDWKDNFYDN